MEKHKRGEEMSLAVKNLMTAIQLIREKDGWLAKSPQFPGLEVRHESDDVAETELKKLIDVEKRKQA